MSLTEALTSEWDIGEASKKRMTDVWRTSRIQEGRVLWCPTRFQAHQLPLRTPVKADEVVSELLDEHEVEETKNEDERLHSIFERIVIMSMRSFYNNSLLYILILTE
ncbi:hypothetical protein NPIL_217021 [Nephila pilipes]|uniref:Uncharacterized protein n=1 Tax=Nephila pilipes TaxID=299642 RepID=A0A8X6MNW9_NEPPI|nr:hypothetical protein NPIL_217021 [Nephila pilipes]